jgi:polyribonucleotide nucleotidyltransferase
VEKIGAVIGPGGRVIRAIIEETGCSIDVADDGGVTIGSSDQTMLDLARGKIEGLTRELVVGDIFTGKVSRMTNFGAFVELMPGKDGLLRSEEMGDIEGDLDDGAEVTVMILEIDNMGRLNLSRPSFGDRGGDRRPGPGGPRPGGGPGGGRGAGFGGNRDRRPGPGGPGSPRPGGNGPRPGGSRPAGGPIQERRFLGGSGNANRQRNDR